MAYWCNSCSVYGHCHVEAMEGALGIVHWRNLVRILAHQAVYFSRRCTAYWFPSVIVITEHLFCSIRELVYNNYFQLVFWCMQETQKQQHFLQFDCKRSCVPQRSVFIVYGCQKLIPLLGREVEVKNFHECISFDENIYCFSSILKGEQKGVQCKFSHGL